jgi:hypothetical protein
LESHRIAASDLMAQNLLLAEFSDEHLKDQSRLLGAKQRDNPNRSVGEGRIIC